MVPGKEQTGARLKFVEKLTEHSSAARQVKASPRSDVKTRHKQARALYQKARSAYDAEDYKTAAELLNQALRTMFEAVRLADPDKVLAEKRERDFQNRLASVNALTDAHNRVSQEKGARAANSELRQLVDRKVSQAHALRQAGKLVEGRRALDEAYVAIKVAIESLRGGDTLVRTLHFDTKKDEYHYEVDRNDTHRMLVDVLLREKMEGSKTIRKMVQSFIDKAAGTRNKAEALAGKGDYDAAVKTMEQSTKDILRAIRSAGIYIPG
jgi:tetratricopeptide (TPR) repeat protein